MNTAEKISTMLNDSFLYKIFESNPNDITTNDGDEKFGAMLYLSALRNKIWNRHISSVFGAVRFYDDDSINEIKKIVGYKVTAHCRVFENEKEKKGAEMARDKILNELNKL